ncbi:MAG TPA: hypothetical protein PLU11_12030 [Chitinophagaceae bacterium]|jgi:hypothetical protein|nr:hypothetical protein [Chitinophagaceae bacterium]HPH32979.1 hypothetical protein [Chitinophagaceae bacterium]HPN59901.1 hypothetical protein [Chitinophagaceae bacterium]
MMKFLLPHRFKKMGMLLLPLGLFLWVGGQSGLFNTLLTSLHFRRPGFQLILITGFFSFLAGIYFLIFSKEKKEDEFIRHIRLESFHFAALFQLLFFVLLFLVMAIFSLEPGGESAFMLLLAGAILLFWLSYIIRFNYILHIKNRVTRE